MADKKISALTAASTPLAGTEVLPIVQSSATKKVAVDDLTVKNIRSNATTGLVQIIGPAAAATRVMTVPDANFTVARIDAANAFVGDQTFSTGNLVMGTAGKGIDFSINSSAPGMTSELLADYEEGTFTPTAGANLTVVGTFSSSGTYTKIGNTVRATIVLNATTSLSWGASASIICDGLPFFANSSGTGVAYDNSFTQLSGITTSGTAVRAFTALNPAAYAIFSLVYGV